MEDNEIVGMLFARSEDGIKILSDKYTGLLNGIAYSILDDSGEAEECVNDTYFKIWNVIPPYRPVFLRSFLCKTVRQIAIDRYRANHAKKRGDSYSLIISELDECIPDKENAEIPDFSAAVINEYVDGLDAETKVLFVKRYFFGESIKALADKFGYSENSVSVKLFRARENLKKRLSKEGYKIERS